MIYRRKSSAGSSLLNHYYWLAAGCWWLYYYANLGQFWTLASVALWLVAFGVKTGLVLRYRAGPNRAIAAGSP